MGRLTTRIAFAAGAAVLAAVFHAASPRSPFQEQLPWKIAEPGSMPAPRTERPRWLWPGGAAAEAMAHELGHVLGLEHRQGVCATMNPRGSYRGPEHCEPAPAGWWHCRLLEPVDVEAAIALYGGAAQPPQTPFCPIYGVKPTR